MKGQVLVDNESGERSLYVPEAHIQVSVIKNGPGKWILAAYRTDGYHGSSPQTAIPTAEHLRQTCQFTAELDVPQRIVDFAVESERRRQEAVADIGEFTMRAMEVGNPLLGFDNFAAQLKAEDEDPDYGEAAEDRIGEEINKLMAQAGGLQ